MDVWDGIGGPGMMLIFTLLLMLLIEVECQIPCSTDLPHSECLPPGWKPGKPFVIALSRSRISSENLEKILSLILEKVEKITWALLVFASSIIKRRSALL